MTQILTVEQAFDDLRRLQELPRYPTPYDTLNRALGLDGLLASQVYVVVGGSGVGKTTWILEVANHFAHNHGPVVFLSLEMPPGYCVARAISPRMGVSSNAILRGEIDVDVTKAGLSSKLHFIERTNLAGLRQVVKQVKDDYERAPLVVIDYLQLLTDEAMNEMAAQGQRPDPRLATAAVSTTIRAIGRDLSCPFLVVSAAGRGSAQKMRGARGRNGKAQDPRDMPPEELIDTARESGSIEYDAAAIFALNVTDEKDVDGFQVGTLTVAKSRFGQRMHIAMSYDGAQAAWYDRGRVEKKKPRAETDTGTLTAERAAEIGQLEGAVTKLLELGPQSTESLRKALRKRRDDIILATSRLSRSGVVTLTGAGPKMRWELNQVTGRLPGLDVAPPPNGPGGHA